MFFKKKLFKEIFQYSSIVLVSFILSIFILTVLWKKNNGVIHSLMELACICIAFTSFLIVWVRYDQHSIHSRIVAFGFLIIAIFDSLHTYYYPILNLLPDGYYDLSTRYWILSRLTESVILLTVSFNLKEFKIKRKTGLVISLIFCLIFFFYLHYHPNLFPILYTSEGFTHTKVLLECLTICILMVTLLKLKKMNPKNKSFDTQYMIMSIYLFITSEVCFTLYHNLDSIFFVFGHILKIASFYYLFKGIIETEINKPYIELEATKNRLNSILDAIPMALHTFNDDLKFDFANKSFEDLLCCSKEKLIGLGSEDLLNVIPIVNDMDQEPLITKMNNGQKSSNFIRSYRNLKGNLIKVKVNMHTIENGMLVLIEDIKKMQKFDNLHLQAITIFNAIPTAVLIVDTRGLITLSNQAFAELLGLAQEDIAGASIYSLSPTLELMNDQLFEHLNNGVFVEKSYETTFTIQQNKKEVSINLSSVRNIDNENIGLIYVLQDITDKKANQQKLINQEKLALLGQMGAAIVHETRNFLTTIKGCSQLILKQTDDFKIKYYAKQIYEDIEEINRIISDFLTISKPREIIKYEIAINDLINSMKSTLETSSLIKGVNIHFTLENIERYIECDEAMIKQVILNICKNAVEAMSEHPKPILSIITELDELKNEVIIVISDNGKGISEENLSKLGSAFFTTKTSGTGLGLNVCYQIIKDHNGKIEVESQQNIGTTFRIILPCIDDEEEDEEYDHG